MWCLQILICVYKGLKLSLFLVSTEAFCSQTLNMLVVSVINRRAFLFDTIFAVFGDFEMCDWRSEVFIRTLFFVRLIPLGCDRGDSHFMSSFSLNRFLSPVLFNLNHELVVRGHVFTWCLHGRANPPLSFTMWKLTAWEMFILEGFCTSTEIIRAFGE